MGELWTETFSACDPILLFWGWTSIWKQVFHNMVKYYTRLSVGDVGEYVLFLCCVTTMP